MEYITIGDLLKNGDVEITTGPFGTQLKASEYQPEGTPVLNVKNIGFGTVVTVKLDRVGYETVQRLQRHILHTGDIVFGRKGAVERHAYISEDEDGWMQGSDCIRLRVKSDQYNSRFLSYAFMTKKHRDFMISMCSHGTTMASLNQEILEKIVFPNASLVIQNRIVNLLSSIDDQIDINEQINDNLVQQAKTIYASMFLNNPPDNWRQGVLSDIAEITMGQSPSGSSYNEDGLGTVFFQGRSEFGFRFPSVRLYTTEPKRMAHENDILMSVRAPVGDLNIAHEDCCIGRGLSAIHSKDNHQSYVLYTMYSLRKELDVFNGEGTVFGSINRDSLNSMLITIPSKEKMDEFETAVAPIDTMIRNNHDRNCRLAQIRDSLLPRLMTSEIDVSKVTL